jgi:hypothetical protein
MTSTGLQTLNINGFLDRTSSEISERARARIRTGIWIYFLLLIFEGALRKWFLPSLAGPLLIVRDPLALWIVVAAWSRGYLDMKHYAILMLIGFIGIYTAFFLGHGNLIVAVYGARIFLLHIPLIFVIGKVLNREDLRNIARWMVVITIPMTMLIMVQFYSPQSAWVNTGVGGEGGAGFSGAMNFYRPPGTFSFTNGNTLFYDLSACFIVYFWFNVKEINRIVLIAASIALVLAIPLSMSRGLLFQVTITLLFAIASILWKPKYLGGLILGVLAFVVVLVLLSFTPYFTTATAAFYSRFESANTIEGGLNGVFLDRFLGGMIEAISLSSHQPFFGYGIGMGTNVGSTLLSGGRYFLLSEGEWGRLIGELGPVFGLIVIFMRLKLAFSIFYRSFWKLNEGILMPWILASCGLLSVAQAGWAQPTSLGFCVLLTGLILAALKERKYEADSIGRL